MPAIKYGSIKSKVSDNLFAAKPIEPLVIPPSANNLEPFEKWLILGNDRYGNCNAVAWANQRRLVSSKLGSKEVYPALDQVLEFYKTQNPKFDPKSNENGAKSPADGGMSIQKGLDFLVQNGGPDGTKALAFAKVDVKNVQDVQAALATFGSLWLGIKVLDNNGQEFEDGKPWTVSADAGHFERHAVLAGGYNPEVQFVTWGRIASFSQGYWTGLLDNPDLRDMVDEAWVVIWPEHVGTRRFMIGVNFQQLAEEFHELTGRILDFPAAPFSSLYFIKALNCGSGVVEVHNAVADDSYATSKVHAVTPIQVNDAPNGTWVVESKDVYFIKTANTGTGSIEVHRLSSESNYSAVDLHQPSGFKAGGASSGIFTIDNGDLYFIKTENTDGGFIELYMAGHQKSFAKIEQHATSTFACGDASNGYLTVRGGDLYLIKTRNTGSGKVEVYVSDGEKDYKNCKHHLTWFSTDDDKNGTWDIGTKGDLYFIKTKNPGSGRVEVHVATADSDYQEVSHYASVYDAADGSNGFWCV